MTISALNFQGSQAADDVAAIRKAAEAAAAASANPTRSSSSVAGPDTTSVSGPGALLSKLKSLQASDPAKLKEVMSEIADKLKSDATSATDPKQQKMLTDLSAKFAAAGQSGDLSQLAPGGGGAGGGHGKHHHGGGGGGGGGSGAGAVSAATDPADANKDGTVTDAERAAYAAVTASPSSSTNGAQAYAKASDGGPQAMSKLAGVMSSITSIVDAAM